MTRSHSTVRPRPAGRAFPLRRRARALLLLLLPVLLLSLWAAPAGADPRTTGPWRPPLAGTLLVVRAFDPPARPWLAGHRGVDLAAEPGSPVLAAGDGTVVYAALLAGRGVVSLDHGGIRTTYEPVDAAVTRGQRVAAGELIGLLAAGHPGCLRAACLHWGARRGEAYLDPLSLLRGPVRLLPISAAAGADAGTTRAVAPRHLARSGPRPV